MQAMQFRVETMDSNIVLEVAAMLDLDPEPLIGTLGE